jgi:hypothetical protein
MSFFSKRQTSLSALLEKTPSKSIGFREFIIVWHSSSHACESRLVLEEDVGFLPQLGEQRPFCYRFDPDLPRKAMVSSCSLYYLTLLLAISDKIAKNRLLFLPLQSKSQFT